MNLKFILLFFLFSAYNLFGQFNAVQVYKACSEGVVYIEVGDEEKLGSGFFINKDGWILTNNHVVINSDGLLYDIDEIKVKTIDGQFHQILKVTDLKTKSGLDLTLIKIDYNPKVILPVLSEGDAEVGEDVVAIGHPKGLEWSQTKGTITNQNHENFLQIDVAVNPGNSGGPLINKFGQVAGIVTAGMKDMQNTNLAIKASKIKPMLKQNSISYKMDALIVPMSMEKSEKTEEQIEAETNLELEKLRNERENVRLQFEREQEIADKKATLEKQRQEDLIEQQEIEAANQRKEMKKRWPKSIVTSLLGGYSSYFGKIDGLSMINESKAWNVSAMLAYRFDTQDIDIRGNLFALFINYGEANSIFTQALLADQDKQYSTDKDNPFQSYLEFEGGILLGEWFRITAGYGTQNLVKPVNIGKPLDRTKAFELYKDEKINYFLGTLGIVMRFGFIDIGSNFTTMIGGNLQKPVVRVNAFAGFRFDFGQW